MTSEFEQTYELRCHETHKTLADRVYRRYRSDFDSPAHVWRAAIISFSRSRLGEPEVARVLRGGRK